MMALQILWWGLWGLVALPVLVLAVQLGSAWAGVASMSIRRPSEGEASRGPVALLVPAHNEQSVIVPTLLGLREQMRPQDRLLVVADNCDDRTAELARSAGAEVVERFDAIRRGKGYALDFGLQHLAGAQTEVLLIVDADCRLEAGAVDQLAIDAIRWQRPVQARYLMTACSGASAGQRIAEWAWRIKNVARPMGMAFWGGPCQLMGTGMAFPWRCVPSLSLANDHLAEDMKLGIDLAQAGWVPRYCYTAVVTSEFPQHDEARRSQRRRWEHGHLNMIVQGVPRLVSAAWQRRDARALALAFDLAVPPLALLAMAQAVSLVGAMALGAATGNWLPVHVGAVSLLTFLATGALAWWGWGRDIVSAGQLLRIPYYALAKVPLYVGFVFRRQKTWVKTRRP